MDLPSRPEPLVGRYVEITTREHGGRYFGWRGVISRAKPEGDLVVAFADGDDGVRELSFSLDEVRLL